MFNFWDECEDVEALDDRDKEYDFGQLENVCVESDIFDLFKYLHGFCDDFALFFSCKYDIEICLLEGYDEETNQKYLIHAFNCFECNGAECYMDIRGITDDIERILLDFDDEVDEIVFKTKLSYKECIKYLSCNKLEYEDELKLIYELFKDYYNVKKYIN